MGGEQKTEKFVIVVLGILLLLFDNHGPRNRMAKKETLGPHCLDLSPGSVPC